MKNIITALLMTLTLTPAANAGSAPSDTIVIAHLCDPQIGFGPKGIDDDLDALRTEIANVNAAKVDLVAIAGDMVNRMDSTSIARFLEAAEAFEAPVVMTPGNHDIAEPCTAAGLAKYRAAFGPDFTERDLGSHVLVAFNSLLYRGGPADEVAEQKALVADALTRAKAAGKPVILLCHVPPFEAEIDEADEYFNLPTAIRRDLIQQFYDGGVRIWLAGHTHKTHRNNYGGITILNGENTSKNFDGRPRGFRLLKIAPDSSFTWEFVPNVASAE